MSAPSSHEFVDEAIVDVDFGSFSRIPEFSAEPAACVPARYDHHVIL
jgi:hypothetical protein